MARAPEGSTLESAELTPELALVDPELAQQARERLPDAVDDAHAPEPAVEQGPVNRIPPAELVATSVVDEPIRAEPPAPTRSRRRRVARVLIAAMAVVGAVALGLAVPRLLLVERNATESAGAPILVPTSAGAADAEPVPTSAPTPASERRSFGWVPVERASHYHVAFFRGEQKIFEAWPKRPPLVLGPEWTFEGRSFSLSPGQYRWVVRPGFGRRKAARYGRPVVDASLLIRR
jgi:hypothetical protein